MVEKLEGNDRNLEVSSQNNPTTSIILKLEVEDHYGLYSTLVATLRYLSSYFSFSSSFNGTPYPSKFTKSIYPSLSPVSKESLELPLTDEQLFIAQEVHFFKLNNL